MLTAQEYYNQLPIRRKAEMNKLREMILSHPAGFIESMAYKLPSYQLDDQVVFACANQKAHIGFYVCETDLKKALPQIFQKYNCGKSCIRIKEVNDEVLHDLAEIIDQLLT